MLSRKTYYNHKKTCFPLVEHPLVGSFKIRQDQFLTSWLGYLGSNFLNSSESTISTISARMGFKIFHLRDSMALLALQGLPP